jgi:hypothetical protein
MTTRDEVQEALARVLLQRVSQDKYPSATEMAMLERILPPTLVRDYVNVLLKKVQADRTPSIPMLSRIGRIAEQLPSGSSR